ncbi:MAG: recombinase RecQ, partial [Betaproteobacteria bacterium]
MASRPSRVASKPPRATPKQPRPRTSDALNKLMRKTFGIKRLRPGQTEVIANVLSGRDTLAIMPTGAGKSL